MTLDKILLAVGIGLGAITTLVTIISSTFIIIWLNNYTENRKKFLSFCVSFIYLGLLISFISFFILAIRISIR